MRRARIIVLDRDLSESEKQRAAEFRAADTRIAAALDRNADAGFAEYLAAAPAILERWQSACRGENLAAGAIISAAIYAQLIALIGGLRTLSSMPAVLLEHRYAQSGQGLPGKSLSLISAALLEDLYVSLRCPTVSGQGIQ